MPKALTFPNIKPEQDITNFLDLVESETKKIFEYYKIAHQKKLKPMGLLTQARLFEIQESYKNNSIDYPWDLYQALAIADLVTSARIHRSQKNCEKLAYDIAMIVGISHKGESVKRRAAGQGKKNYVSPFSQLLLDTIKKSKQDNPACTDKDIVDNIIPNYEDDEYYYFHSLGLIAQYPLTHEKKKNKLLEYSEFGRALKPVQADTLKNRIGALRRKQINKR
jgi:hypothetical protein